MKKPTDIPSKRRSGRHDESATTRWRELKLYRRVDRYGNPLDYTPQEIAEMMARHEHNAPPQLFPDRNNPLPDNVTPITKNKGKAKAKPVAVSGNEAEKVDRPAAPAEQSLVAKHHSAVIRTRIELEKEAYARWSANAEAGKIAGFAVGDQLIEQQRERSKAGHSKVKGPIRRNHNYGLSDTPIVHDTGVTGKAGHGGYATKTGMTVAEGNKKLRAVAPSGLPISDFLKGGKHAPPETAVVYTTNPPDKTARYGPAANDSHSPAKHWAESRTSYVQWFINHVEPQNWHSLVYEYVRWTNEGPVVNTGAINKAAAKLEEQNTLLKAMNDSHEKEWRMLDSALSDAHSENNLLRQELKATQMELKNLEFVHAHSIGDYESAQQIAEELVGKYVSKPKTPPEDADELVSQYNLYNSFVQVDGPEFAFARYVYGDPKLGQVIRDHADMNYEHRMHLFNEREALRRIGANVRERLSTCPIKYPEIKRFRECAALYRISRNIREAGLDNSEYATWWKTTLDNKRSTYYSRLTYKRLEHDTLLFSKWGKKATPLNRKKPVNYQQVINDVVGVRSFCYTAPHLVDYHKDIGIKYRRHMNTKMTRHYLSQTKVGTAAKLVNKVVGWLNTEVNPIERKRMKREQEEQRLRKQEARQRKMQRRAEREAKAKQQKSRIFDAELKLKSRGFVIVDK